MVQEQEKPCSNDVTDQADSHVQVYGTPSGRRMKSSTLRRTLVSICITFPLILDPTQSFAAQKPKKATAQKPQPTPQETARARATQEAAAQKAREEAARRAAEQAAQAAREAAVREAAARKAAAEKFAQEIAAQKVREAAAAREREEAAWKAAAEKAAQEAAARERAAQAERDRQAAAAREEAARRETAAREEAARKAAAEKAAQEKAAQEAVAKRERDVAAAREEAARKEATRKEAAAREEVTRKAEQEKTAQAAREATARAEAARQEAAAREEAAKKAAAAQAAREREEIARKAAAAREDAAQTAAAEKAAKEKVKKQEAAAEKASQENAVQETAGVVKAARPPQPVEVLQRISSSNRKRPPSPLFPPDKRQPPGSNGLIPQGKEKLPAYAPGQILVKVKSLAGSVFDRTLDAKTLQLRPTQTGVGSISMLNQQYGVVRMSPVFQALKVQQLTSHKSTTQLARETQARFPKRAKRVPLGVEVPRLTDVYKLELKDPQANPLAICEAYKKDPAVEYCEPNYVATLQTLPNDTYVDPDQNGTWSTGAWGQSYEDLWGLKRIHMEEAWKITQGSPEIVVAVSDTGLDYNHPDIQGNVWTNPGEIPNNSIDDDSNGYVDDVRGWDFTTCAALDALGCVTAKPPDNDPMDDHGHGTHVSGIIAAEGNNGIGIIGVAPQAKVMPVKALNAQGFGWSSELAVGIVYAAQNGAEVINNSWGCDSCPSNQVAEEAVRFAYGHGAVVVFAAGNGSTDAASSSPQNMADPKPVVVTASTPTDEPTFFTNFGPLVDVAAPGGGVRDDQYPPGSIGRTFYRNILSLKSALCSEMCPPWLVVGNQYVRQAGTSMAAPYAAGVAALVLAAHPSFTNEDIRQVLRVSADDVKGPGFDLYTGTGRLNAARAVAIETPPRGTFKILEPTPTRTIYRGGPPALSIIGTAASPAFQQYELSYGEGRIPMSWEPIGKPSLTPVTAGQLGSWIIPSGPAGLSLLRLAGRLLNGQQLQDVVPLILNNPPVLLTGLVTRGAPYYETPAISGNRIVWVSWPPKVHSIPQVELYDLRTHVAQPLSPTRAAQISPAIWGDRVVWTDFRNGNWDIYLRDLATNTERAITTDPADQFSPDIWGDRVVWTDFRNGNWDIYLYDLATNTEQRITTDPGSQTQPAISKDTIVWRDDRLGRARRPGGPFWNYDIFLCEYDPVAKRCVEHSITNDDHNHWNPDISDNRVVWNGYADDNVWTSDWWEWNVYSCEYDPVTQRCPTRRLSRPYRIALGPRISGSRVVWTELFGDDVYLYDLVTNSGGPLNTKPGSWDWSEPAIAGDRIVWMAYWEGQSYLHDLSPSPVLWGTIQDESGRPITERVMLLLSRKKGRGESKKPKPIIVETDNRGYYRFSIDLQPGTYTLTPKQTKALKAAGITRFYDQADPKRKRRSRVIELTTGQNQLQINFVAVRKPSQAASAQPSQALPVQPLVSPLLTPLQAVYEPEEAAEEEP